MTNRKLAFAMLCGYLYSCSWLRALRICALSFRAGILFTSKIADPGSSTAHASTNLFSSTRMSRADKNDAKAFRVRSWRSPPSGELALELATVRREVS